MTPNEIITKAQDVLRERGLAKTAILDDRGHCCALGALVIAAGHLDDARVGCFPGTIEDEDLHDAVRQVANSMYDYDSVHIDQAERLIYRFNDKPETTCDDVLGVFAKAVAA